MTDNGSGGETELPSTDYPDLLARLEEVTDASLFVVPGKTGDYYSKALAYVENRPQRDLFYVADVPEGSGFATSTEAISDLLTTASTLSTSDMAAVYYPWVIVPDPVGAGMDPTYQVPPSGFVTGLYARTDARRGVWKAAAGVDATVLGIRELEYNILDSHQDDMNPKGLNALRVMPGAGAVVWGARTLKPSTEWRYVSVRRTAIFLRKSIYNGIQWAVFEPNDEDLWASLRVTIGAFMEQQFRRGAFAGKTSKEGYFVKCDADTTTPDDQAAGFVGGRLCKYPGGICAPAPGRICRCQAQSKSQHAKLEVTDGQVRGKYPPKRSL
jgi:phage tail sheath protein FI